MASAEPNCLGIFLTVGLSGAGADKAEVAARSPPPSLPSPSPSHRPHGAHAEAQPGRGQGTGTTPVVPGRGERACGAPWELRPLDGFCSCGCGLGVAEGQRAGGGGGAGRWQGGGACCPALPSAGVQRAPKIRPRRQGPDPGRGAGQTRKSFLTGCLSGSEVPVSGGV